jgi:phosphoglycerate-specific signal transduction histidine kinase
VTAIAAALLETNAARRQIKLVVNDENFVGGDFVKIGQCGNRLT